MSFIDNDLLFFGRFEDRGILSCFSSFSSFLFRVLSGLLFFVGDEWDRGLISLRSIDGAGDRLYSGGLPVPPPNARGVGLRPRPLVCALDDDDTVAVVLYRRRILFRCRFASGVLLCSLPSFPPTSLFSESSSTLVSTSTSSLFLKLLITIDRLLPVVVDLAGDSLIGGLDCNNVL